jgi:hypothetical protein
MKKLAGRLPQATVSALNWTGDRARTQVTRAMVKTTGIKYSDFQNAIRRKPASLDSMSYELIARSQWTPLSYFRPQQMSAGVRASPWATRQLFQRAFIATMPGGQPQVWVRVRQQNQQVRDFHRARGEKAPPQTQLHMLWGPSIAREMQKFPVPQIFEDEIETRYPARLTHEINRIIAGPRTRVVEP